MPSSNSHSSRKRRARKMARRGRSSTLTPHMFGLKLEMPPSEVIKRLFSGGYNYQPSSRVTEAKKLPPRPPRPFVRQDRDLIPIADTRGRSRAVGKHRPDDNPRSFLEFPSELRNKIYCELFVAKMPILVHKNWRHLFMGGCHMRARTRTRSQSRVQTGIRAINLLYTCRQIFHEGVAVLYGNNVFEYIVRDVVSDRSRPTDRPLMLNDLEEDSAYDTDEELEQRRSLRRRCRDSENGDKGDSDIFFARYAHLFNNVSIHIEPNRDSPEYRSAMARAIMDFARGTVSPVRLCSLTIRICPQRNNVGLQYTYADFICSGSEIIEALEAVKMRSFSLVIDTRMLGKGSRVSICCNMDYKNADTGLDDVRAVGIADTRMMTLVRRERARRVDKRLHGLAEEMSKRCAVVEEEFRASTEAGPAGEEAEEEAEDEAEEDEDDDGGDDGEDVQMHDDDVVGAEYLAASIQMFRHDFDVGEIETVPLDLDVGLESLLLHESESGSESES